MTKRTKGCGKESSGGSSMKTVRGGWGGCGWVAVVVGLLITGGTGWGATYFNVRTSGGSYGTPYAYFGVGATAAGGYWEQYRKTDSGAYPGVTGTALTFDTVRYEELHQGCGGSGCHFVAPGVFFGNAPGSIPSNPGPTVEHHT